MYGLRVREQNDENPVPDGITELLIPTPDCLCLVLLH